MIVSAEAALTTVTESVDRKGSSLIDRQVTLMSTQYCFSRDTKLMRPVVWFSVIVGPSLMTSGQCEINSHQAE